MKALRRAWHGVAGHKDVNVELSGTNWSAWCVCGYRFHVRHFTMGTLGPTEESTSEAA
jgi:hypothetical protein